MTKKKISAEMVEVEGTTQVDIDKDDVIAIGVVEAENYLQEQFESAREQARDAQLRAEDLRKRIRKKLQDLAEKETRDQVQAIRDAAKALGFAAKNVAIEVNASGQPFETKGKPCFNAHITSRLLNSNSAHPRDFRISSYKEYRVPADVQKLVGDCDAAHEMHEKKSSEALQWKRKQTMIGRYERQLRAKLARTRLSSSEAGKKLIKAMTENVRNEVLGLPSS